MTSKFIISHQSIIPSLIAEKAKPAFAFFTELFAIKRIIDLY
jgi:hypothetical protein